ncbi:MAG: GntR family transcriptional regulator [Rhodospirillales bacterium]
MLWGLQPVQQKAAYGLAVERLRRLIRLGLLLPSERMPPERKLAEQISISRVTLREALKVLESEAYVLVKRGSQGGTFVQQEAELRRMAQRQLAGDPAAALRVYEYRETTEPTGARFAAVRRTPADLKQLATALREIDKAESVGALRRGQNLLHLAVAEASGNRFLAKGLEDALTALFLPLEEGPLDRRRAETLSLLSPLYEAIQARHEPEAERRMTAILAQQRRRLPNLRVA